MREISLSSRQVVMSASSLRISSTALSMAARDVSFVDGVRRQRDEVEPRAHRTRFHADLGARAVLRRARRRRRHAGRRRRRAGLAVASGRDDGRAPCQSVKTGHASFRCSYTSTRMFVGHPKSLAAERSGACCSSTSRYRVTVPATLPRIAIAYLAWWPALATFVVRRSDPRRSHCGLGPRRPQRAAGSASPPRPAVRPLP